MVARSRNSFMARDRQRRLNNNRARERRARMGEIQGFERQRQIRAIVRGANRSRREREALPTYDIDVTRTDGNIHTITIRPITTGEANYSLVAAEKNIAALLKIYTRDKVMEATGWTETMALNRIRGFIQVTNTMNPASSQFYKFSNLRDITKNKIDLIFTQMQQSETEVPFENLEFMIVIDPATYQTGAGTELSMKRGKGLGWATYYDELGPINCAAIALILLTKKERFDQKKPLLKR